MNKLFALVLIFLAMSYLVSGQNSKTKSMPSTNQQNPLLCDPISGICEIPDTTASTTKSTISEVFKKPIKVIYFTDPICSSCWGIEPQLRKLKLEYGDSIEIEYKMGGLLPDWSYNSGGISKPSDVAKHWDEVSHHYEMPIDGDVWLEDPLNSSYPPSIAFKAAQIQDKQKAIAFMRRMREMVFLEKKNITKWEYIEQAALETGLNVSQLKTDFDGKAIELFQADLSLAKQLGVRGFPTLLFLNDKNEEQKIYGSKPYSVFESVMNQLLPKNHKAEYPLTAEYLFQHYPSLTVKEFAILANTSYILAEKTLQELYEKKKLNQFQTKNGALYIGKSKRF